METGAPTCASRSSASCGGRSRPSSPTRCVNLARGGALIESRTPLNPDAVRAVRLGFDGTSHDIQVKVRHVTSEPVPGGERFLVGLEFVEPSAAALEQIDNVVAARLAETKPAAEA